MVLAAGEGTRLLPLTLGKPKPLFPLLNRPLLAWVFKYLHRFQVQRLFLNSHHLSKQMEAYLTGSEVPGGFGELQLRPEPVILGTGGGIKNSEGFWRFDPFLVLNGDIFTDIDLFPAIEFHRQQEGPVTLVLHDHPSFNNIIVDEQGRIRGLRAPSGGQWAFTGIHIMDREIFGYLPPVDYYDIIPVYQDLIRKGIPIRGYLVHGHYWRDMGTLQSYRRLHEDILTGRLPNVFRPNQGGRRFPSTWCLHPQALIEEGVWLEGWGAIGKDCRLGKGCRLRNSILWDRVTVREGVRIEGAIVPEDRVVGNDFSGDTI
jgi:mannose-1-phosphate guanylyltransferase